MRIYKVSFITSLLAVLMTGCGSSNNGSSLSRRHHRPHREFYKPWRHDHRGSHQPEAHRHLQRGNGPCNLRRHMFTLKQGVTTVPGAASCVGRTATFAPTSISQTVPPMRLRSRPGSSDLAGNALAANKTWSFTTGAATDTTAPTVSSTDPADTATGVVVNRNLTATFSEAIDPATITATSFTLKQGATPVSGSVTSTGSVATLDPASNLAASTLIYRHDHDWG